MPMQVTKIDRLVYRLCLGYHGLGRAMPLKAWLGMGRRLGALAYRLDRDHRRIVHRNLHLAYGDAKDKDAIRRLARRNFEQWGMIAQELALLKQRPEWLAAHLKAVIDVEGRDRHTLIFRETAYDLLTESHHVNLVRSVGKPAVACIVECLGQEKIV